MEPSTTETATRKLAAILSADAAGYSRLMEEDEADTIRTLSAYREAISKIISQHHGRVVDTPGDNLLAEFASAVNALNCAVDIQNALKARNAKLTENRRMASEPAALQQRHELELPDIPPTYHRSPFYPSIT